MKLITILGIVAFIAIDNRNDNGLIRKINTDIINSQSTSET